MPVRRHLNPDQLVAAGEGAPDDAMRAHLAECERCSQQVTQLNRLLNIITVDELETPPRAVTAAIFAMLPPAAPRPSLVERLKAVLRLDSGMGTLAYGLRGGADAPRQLLYDAEPYEIDLRLRPEGQNWHLMGQLLGDAEEGSVRLTGSGNDYVSDINEMGEFLFRNIPAGAYTLVVALPEAELEISDLKLGMG